VLPEEEVDRNPFGRAFSVHGVEELVAAGSAGPDTVFYSLIGVW